MKRTFQVRITLADGAVHIRRVSASSAVELLGCVREIAKQYPAYVRAEGTLLKDKP